MHSVSSSSSVYFYIGLPMPRRDEDSGVLMTTGMIRCGDNMNPLRLRRKHKATAADYIQKKGGCE